MKVCRHSRVNPEPEGCAFCARLLAARQQQPAPVVNVPTLEVSFEVNHNTIVIEHGGSGIGDGLLAATAVTQLRDDCPDRKIMLRVGPNAVPFVALFACCDQIATATKLHTDDAVHDAWQLNRGYRDEATSRLNKPRWERYRDNIGASGNAIPTLREPKRIRDLTRRFVGFVALCPYSTDATREWSLQHWLTLERLLIASGYECVVLHDGDTKNVAKFRSEKWLGKPAEQVASVLLNACCVIGSDSGLAHLGAILGTPTIVLGGWADVSKIFGVYPAARFIQGGLDCSNCCRLPEVMGPHCGQSCANLQTITPATVLDKVDEIVLAAVGGVGDDGTETTALDWMRLRNLRDAVRATNHLQGDLAEVGVWRGGSAKTACHYARQPYTMHLFDTFVGIPEDDQHGEHKRGDFDDTSVEAVRQLLADLPVEFHVGVFPETIPEYSGKILFLDDLQNRWDRFCPVYPAATWARTLDEFQSLVHGEWDVISLDHDLTDEGPDKGKDRTIFNGVAACRMIPVECKARLVVHSTNGGGAKRMRETLAERGLSAPHIPFDYKSFDGKCTPTFRSVQRYRFVHLDGDTYQTTRAALEYFVPRMVPGGIILFDDFDWRRTPGVRKAAEEFFKPEQIVHRQVRFDDARNEQINPAPAVRQPLPLPLLCGPGNRRGSGE